MISRGERPGNRLRIAADGSWTLDGLPGVTGTASRRDAPDAARAAAAAVLDVPAESFDVTSPPVPPARRWGSSLRRPPTATFDYPDRGFGEMSAAEVHRATLVILASSTAHVMSVEETRCRLTSAAPPYRHFQSGHREAGDYLTRRRDRPCPQVETYAKG